ncbi:MAG: hypothetical protein IPK05_14320 [Comamonadaceae bacterium]|nr:hypothetical protein [Comamonadaceae bacterium]
MPETTFDIPSLTDQDAADAVMFVLHDLPCIHQAEPARAQRLGEPQHHDRRRRHRHRPCRRRL